MDDNHVNTKSTIQTSFRSKPCDRKINPDGLMYDNIKRVLDKTMKKIKKWSKKQRLPNFS